MSAYYNEHDPFAAAWLRALIAENLIAPGEVDERDIQQVSYEDVKHFTQVHLFAGIGGWSVRLRLADWPDHRPVWTGSCPCQPFSCSGEQKGEADERHLWPEMHRLLDLGRPSECFGEQVASKLGREWLAGVRTDLEALGYEVGAADLCAAGVGAPHIRQRLFWGARRVPNSVACGRDSWSGVAAGEISERIGRLKPFRYGETGGLLHSVGARLEGHSGDVADRHQSGRIGTIEDRSVAPAGRDRPWDAYELIDFSDGKTRRIEPGTFPLADGISNRVGLLRGYGNAIVPQVAEEFVKAFMECMP